MKEGLSKLLEKSADLLDQMAEEIKSSHTINGWWPKEKKDAKKKFDEIKNTVKRLRKASDYHKKNSLDGPAKMFDWIADRIRAGDSMHECLSDYGIGFINRSSDSEIANKQ